VGGGAAGGVPAAGAAGAAGASGLAAAVASLVGPILAGIGVNTLANELGTQWSRALAGNNTALAGKIETGFKAGLTLTMGPLQTLHDLPGHIADLAGAINGQKSSTTNLAGIMGDISSRITSALKVSTQGGFTGQVGNRGRFPDLEAGLQKVEAKTADVEAATDEVGGETRKVKGAVDILKVEQIKGASNIKATIQSGDAKLLNSLAALRGSVMNASSLNWAGHRNTAGAVNAARSGIMAATHNAAAIVANAVRSSRPIITTNVKVYVTAASVSKSVSVQARYGAGNGSSGGGNPNRPGGW
jgi:hypothetical protein